VTSTQTAVGARPAGRGGARQARQLADLVLHLTRRQLESQHRFTLLGWAWPLIRQLAQLAVLVFLFSKVLDLGIDDYPAFVFSGLLVWSWFAAGLVAATSSLDNGRHLVFSPRFPDVALPLVAVAVPVVDLLMALPVVLAMLVAEGRLAAPALLLPLLLAALFLFTAGIGMLTAASNVFFRDVANAVSVGLLLSFYLTPIFFSTRNVPERFRWVVDVNPIAAHVDAVRAVLFEGQLPSLGDALVVATVSPIAAAIGWHVFRRLQPRFVDEL
jgi:lipopolysaccharide transport system permease protein